MQIDLKGKIALVTGGARGLGRGFSVALSQAGAKTFFTSRSKDAITEVEEEMKNHGLEGEGIFLDITEGVGPELLNQWFVERGCHPDILINNVGHTLGITNYNAPLSDWTKVMELNFLVHVETSNKFLPQMRAKNWGRIVNITSIAGLEVSGPPQFNCSKAALTAYTRSVGRLLAIESPGVVMTAVAPGIIETSDGHWENMKKTNPKHVEEYMQHRAALKRFGRIDEITNVVVFLSSDQASFFHGSIVQVDGGQSRSYFPHTYFE